MSKAFDVIVLNSHGVGQYAYCDHMPVWGETLSVKNWHVAEDGGKGSNVTVALGLRVAYIGKVGNDPWGDLGDKWMRDAGADTTYLYMLGYYDMRSPGVKGIHRFLARLCDGPVGMRIIRIDLP